MKLIKNEKGFTLVELAIVMAIIGLLIGGILKGQELMENARVASTVSQIKSYEAAVTTFRDTFNAMPGDMPNAGTRLPNCTGTCIPVALTAGNQIVGTPDAAGSGHGITAANPMPGAAANETSLFWVHLLLADLIGGVTDTAVRAPAAGASWANTHPVAKIGGGFFVGHSDGSFATNPLNMPGRLSPVTVRMPVGTVLVLRNSVTGIVSAAPGIQPMSPLRAAQIDRKIDDGQSDTGTVQAYGVSANCYRLAPGGVAGTGPFIYNETVKAKDCGLMIQIQG